MRMDAKERADKITVGELVYMDGRDHDAQPPLTVGTINLWDGVPRRWVVGRVKHGTRVKVVACHQADGRWYYCVSKGRKRGWVSDAFVSAEKHEPIGTLFRG